MELFDRDGYDATTVDDIAAALGIGRRTVFRYFASKADIVWGEFDAELERLDRHLRDAPDGEPLFDCLRRAVVGTNHFGAGELGELRVRIRLIESVDALVAHSAVRYAEWRRVVADFAARRLGGEPDDLPAETLSRAALGAATAAFTCWVRRGDDDLSGDLDRAFELLARGFALPSRPLGHRRRPAQATAGSVAGAVVGVAGGRGSTPPPSERDAGHSRRSDDEVDEVDEQSRRGGTPP